MDKGLRTEFQALRYLLSKDMVTSTSEVEEIPHLDPTESIRCAIRDLGIKNIVAAIGIKDIVAAIGFETIINARGLERAVQELSPTKRKRLKELL